MGHDEGQARLGDEARQTGNSADARRLVATGNGVDLQNGVGRQVIVARRHKVNRFGELGWRSLRVVRRLCELVSWRSTTPSPLVFLFGAILVSLEQRGC